MSDLVIRGGTVIDGTGAPGVRRRRRHRRRPHHRDRSEPARRARARRRRVASSRRASSTSTPTTTRRSSGIRRCTPSCFHGVTTVVAGNCGFSIAPTRPEHHDLIARTLENVEDMDVADARRRASRGTSRPSPSTSTSVERRGTGLNFAAYIGHTALRLFVMGDDGVRARGHARGDRRTWRPSSARR